jgi:hypothetical protein
VIDPIIVMLPDPRRTRLTLDFDRYIQTIERAIDADMDRFWLPWTAEREPSAGDASDATQQQPGLIWFRKNLEQPRYTAAFLIGETPVAGVNQSALRNALLYSKMLNANQSVRIAGPFSTGGLPSLKRALAEAGYSCDPQGDKVRIVSGTVTGNDQEPFRECWNFQTVASADKETLRWLPVAEPARTAKLTEAATAYGDQEFAKLGPDAEQTLELSFPRELAWLRKAYEEDPQLSQDASAQEAMARSTLRGRLEADFVGTDTAPIFSRSQTPLVQEAELLAAARQVKEHHISHMVIFATDTLDSTFLARFFRKCCDVRPILFEPDLYLARRDGFPLTGALVLNRTLLLPQAEGGNVFSSGSVWGLYVSIRRLLYNQDLAKDSAIWLAVVGKNGYWPVDKLQAKPVDHWPLRASRAWQNAMLAVTLLLIVFCWAIVFPQRAGSSFSPRRVFWNFRVDGHYGRERSPYVLGALLSLACIAVALGLPVLDARLDLQGIEPGAVKLLLAIVAAIVAFAAIRIRLSKPPWLGIAVWTVFTAIFVVWYQSLFGNSRELFFGLRAVHIESGVSPALPLICLILVLGAWCWTQIFRLRVYHERQPVVPTPDASDRIWAVRTRRAFLHPLVQGWKMFAFIFTLVLLLCLAAGGGDMLATIEGPLYDWTFRLLLLLVALLVVMSLARLHYAWRTLWDVLQHIETQPFREKFEQVGRDFNWYSIFQPGGATVNLRPVDRSFECAREIAHAARGDEELHEELTLMESLEPARAKFKNRLLSLRFASQEEAISLAADTHQALVEVTEVLVRKYGDIPRGKKPSVVRDLIDEFISLQYVHYIRQVFVLFSQLASFVMTAFVLLVVALNSYPFSQPRSISMWVLSSFLAVTAFTVIIFWQMDRDPVLSRMSNTQGGKLDRHFWTLLVQYGGLPFIAVVSSQFPELGPTLSRWLGATGDLLK